MPLTPDKADLTTETRVTPLLQQGTGVRPRIKILFENGEELTNPRVVTIVLRNVGAAAVSESMYDGHPYIVRLGATVIGDLLRRENSSPQQTAPLVKINADTLEIGPGAIHPGQRLTYSVLVDGEEKVEHVSPLLNITPREIPNEAERLIDAERQRWREREFDSGRRWWRIAADPSHSSVCLLHV